MKRKLLLILIVTILSCKTEKKQESEKQIAFSQSDFTIQNVKFESQGVTLAGSILTPKTP